MSDTATTTLDTVTTVEPVGTGAPPVRWSETRRILNLAWTLGLTDWKLRFYGSALGALWTLVRPFAFFGVILFVFTEIAQLDANVDHYSVYILFALVFFTFFAEVTTASVTSLVDREGLLRKMHFDPIVIPLSLAITALLNLGLTFLAVLIFVFANGVWPDWGWLELIPLVLALTMFSVGLGMLLSVLYVRYRDIRPIWEVASQMLFYGSAILYVATTIPLQYQHYVLCNPLAAIFSQIRHAVVDDNAPTIIDLMGWRALVPAGIILFTFVFGVWWFRRESPRVAENL
jgi:ABC-2 type transport system permease protein